ncbi:MAG TPA: MFS transporter, partial [Alphaproteobacteria bacterium]|nr:MFS transporter [Alphaproteobacteria bacterium]
ALNGASFGGIIGIPALVAAVDWVGLAPALLAGSAVMAIVLVPMTVAWVGRPSSVSAAGVRSGKTAASPRNGAPPRADWTRRLALHSIAFWTVTAPFALVLLAQVGFLVHQIAFLEPKTGRALAGVAVAGTAIAAVLGRIGLGVVIDRLDRRLVSAACFLLQAAALFVLTKAESTAVLLASCGVFGLSVGNVITLPALIIQSEFDATAFAMLVGLSTAIGQFAYAFGPGLLGLLRDLSGGYEAPLLVCISLETAAAGIVVLRGHRTR